MKSALISMMNLSLKSATIHRANRDVCDLMSCKIDVGIFIELYSECFWFEK